MLEENFTAVMVSALPALHKFFYRHLKGMDMQGELEHCIDDLVQITSLQAYVNSQKKSLASYGIRTLLFLKARNNLAEFFSGVKKSSRNVNLDDLFDAASPDPDPYERLAQRDALAKVRRLVDRDTMDLFYQLLDNVSYRELANKRQTSEAALRMRVYRLRKLLFEMHSF